MIPGEGGGLDESSGAPADPFGDVETLIDCDGTDCEVDPELLLNLMAWFQVFYDEGVTLTLVSSSVLCGPGAQISGLGAGESAKELADQFGVSNGDVISKVNSTNLTSTYNAALVLDKVASDVSFTVDVKSRTASCATQTFTIDVADP